jgi:hypothetical protein
VTTKILAITEGVFASSIPTRNDDAINDMSKYRYKIPVSALCYQIRATLIACGRKIFFHVKIKNAQGEGKKFTGT